MRNSLQEGKGGGQGGGKGGAHGGHHQAEGGVEPRWMFTWHLWASFCFWGGNIFPIGTNQTIIQKLVINSL